MDARQLPKPRGAGGKHGRGWLPAAQPRPRNMRQQGLLYVAPSWLGNVAHLSGALMCMMPNPSHLDNHSGWRPIGMATSPNGSNQIGYQSNWPQTRMAAGSKLDEGAEAYHALCIGM